MWKPGKRRECEDMEVQRWIRGQGVHYLELADRAMSRQLMSNKNVIVL